MRTRPGSRVAQTTSPVAASIRTTPGLLAALGHDQAPAVCGDRRLKGLPARRHLDVSRRVTPVSASIARTNGRFSVT